MLPPSPKMTEKNICFKLRHLRTLMSAHFWASHSHQELGKRGKSMGVDLPIFSLGRNQLGHTSLLSKKYEIYQK